MASPSHDPALAENFPTGSREKERDKLMADVAGNNFISSSNKELVKGCSAHRQLF